MKHSAVNAGECREVCYLKARYGKLVTNVEFSIPVTNEHDRERLKGMLQTLREE